ncbi:MAG TPA: chromate resistance protein ChrB domain-containing protein [Candidatus Binatia bacterium]|nr:chromate resistance protein ChrB domain-containing protein [Candidatus Binatia bacterium]
MPDAPWLLLIHQLPPKPTQLRVKVWRRLQTLGAVAVKNSVYVLPLRDESREDFAWLLREIQSAGGEGSLCEARFVDGLRDEQVEALFNAARATDYRQIADEARAGPPDTARLRRRLDEVVARDFFGAAGREAAAGLVTALEAEAGTARGDATMDASTMRGRTWVTRIGVHVDRIATAWLIRRFVDPEAQFKFVPARGYRPLPDEVRFDMFDAELTHEGDRCTFEVVVARFGLRDRALTALAEIIHDIDLKDGRFGRPETAGFEALVAGLALAHRDDTERLSRGAAVLDDLYAFFRRRR